MAAYDAMWAVLSHKDKRGNKWTEEEFFATGRAEIELIMGEIGEQCPQRERALDFGCGVGRLTKALGEHFKEAWGVDVSSGMIQRAIQFSPECHFRLNDVDNLSQFGDGEFDLVYTNIVLQHMPSREIITRYIEEFFRATRVGGRVLFQVPYRKSIRNSFNPKRTVYHALKALGCTSQALFSRLNLHSMRMTAISRERVHAVIEAAGGEIVKERPNGSSHYAYFYMCRKM